MLKRSLLTVAVSLPLLCHAGPAYGYAAASSAGDPSSGSPSGSVYQLPFESGRADAAPKGDGGTGAPEPGPSGGGGSGDATTGSGESSEPSLYRSENNFGSSSHVPGAGSSAGGGAGSGSGGGSGGDGGSGGAGEGGTGSGGGGSGSTSGASASDVTDSGNTSPAANMGLLVLIAAVAGGIGFLALRSDRLKPQR